MILRSLLIVVTPYVIVCHSYSPYNDFVFSSRLCYVHFVRACPCFSHFSSVFVLYCHFVVVCRFDSPYSHFVLKRRWFYSHFVCAGQFHSHFLFVLEFDYHFVVVCQFYSPYSHFVFVKSVILQSSMSVSVSMTMKMTFTYIFYSHCKVSYFTVMLYVKVIFIVIFCWNLYLIIIL